MPGSLRLDNDPFASILSGDPFEAALKETAKQHAAMLAKERDLKLQAQQRARDARVAHDDAAVPPRREVLVAQIRGRQHDGVVDGGGKCYIHCHQGVSRSSSMPRNSPPCRGV